MTKPQAYNLLKVSGPQQPPCAVLRSVLRDELPLYSFDHSITSFSWLILLSEEPLLAELVDQLPDAVRLVPSKHNG